MFRKQATRSGLTALAVAAGVVALAVWFLVESGDRAVVDSGRPIVPESLIAEMSLTRLEPAGCNSTWRYWARDERAQWRFESNNTCIGKVIEVANESTQWNFNADADRLTIKGRASDGPFQPASFFTDRLFETGSDENPGLSFRILGTTSLIGREAHIIEVLPKGLGLLSPSEHELGRHLYWVDVETHITLARETYTDEGFLLEKTEMTRLEIDVEIDPSLFEPLTPEDASVNDDITPG